MSRFAALFWLLLAAILGAAVWATAPRERVTSGENPLLPDFSFSGCEGLGIVWPDGQSAALEKGPLEGMWLLRASPDGQTEISWPAESGRVQGLLRLIGELRVDASPSPGAPMPKAIVLTLARKNAPPIRLAVDPSTLGGSGRIALMDDASRVVSLARVSDSFVRALDRTAIDSWRLADLLPWPPEASSSIRSTSSAGETDLARAGSGWIMQAPITTKADAGAVQAVLLLLSKTSFERFLPESAGGESGFSPPSRKIVIGARPAAGNPASRIEQRVEVGPMLDSQSRVVRVSASKEGTDQPLWGPLYGVVDTSTLAAISEDPAAYVSRITVDVAPADVSGLDIGEGHQPLKRDPSGSFGQADSTVREFLRIICETPAASAAIRAAADAVNPPESTRVRLLGPEGQVLRELAVRTSTIPSKIAGSPATSAFEVSDGRIVRLIPSQRPRDILAALADASKQPPH